MEDGSKANQDTRRRRWNAFKKRHEQDTFYHLIEQAKNQKKYHQQIAECDKQIQEREAKLNKKPKSTEFQKKAKQKAEQIDKAWAESVIGSKLSTSHGIFVLDRIDYSAKNGKHFICKFDDDDNDGNDYPMTYKDVKNHLVTA